MTNPIERNIGYHRALVVLCTLLLWWFYPTEEVPTLDKANFLEFPKALVFLIPPKFYFFFLLWVSLSDLLSNLWRFAEYVFKKKDAWNFWPLLVDFLLVFLLWRFYGHKVNPKPPEEETEEALLHWIIETSQWAMAHLEFLPLFGG